MRNLAFTNSVLKPSDERPTKRYSSASNAYSTPLTLISKPLVSGLSVPDKPIWKGFSSNLLDVKRDPRTSVISFVMHAAILALILWFVFQAHKQIVVPLVAITPLYIIKPYIPVTLPATKTMGGGGGGGAHQMVEASKGRIPLVAKTQIVPIEMLKVDHPKLAAAPVVAIPQPVKLPQTQMPDLGDTQSPQVALASQGTGSGSGFGQGQGGGIGSGRGAGVGAGNGGGYGGGIMSVGGGVTAPQIVHSVEPEFTNAARQTKYQGTVSIQLIVDSQGNPEDIRVIRHLGMGLDEKAIDAVRQYRFRPAMYQGHPVSVQMVIEVGFHLY